MNTVFDLAPLWRSSVGFERLFDLMNQVAKWEPADNYPPYNIAKTEDETYRITLAVAGFTADELSITSQPNLLVVTGKRPSARTDLISTRGLPDARMSDGSTSPNT